MGSSSNGPLGSYDLTINNNFFCVAKSIGGGGMHIFWNNTTPCQVDLLD